MEDAPFSFIRVGREMGTLGHINCHRSRRRANTACIDPYAMGDWKERLHGMVWGPVWGGRGACEPIDGVAMACNGCCGVLQAPSHGGALNRKSGFESASQMDRVMRCRSRNLDLFSRDGWRNAAMGERRRGHREMILVNWHLIGPSSCRFFGIDRTSLPANYCLPSGKKGGRLPLDPLMVGAPTERT